MSIKGKILIKLNIIKHESDSIEKVRCFVQVLNIIEAGNWELDKLLKNQQGNTGLPDNRKMPSRIGFGWAKEETNATSKTVEANDALVLAFYLKFCRNNHAERLWKSF